MKKTFTIVFIILLILIMLSVIFAIIDYNRVKNQENPIFCIKIKIYRDGGTIEYIGLGYKVIEYHKLDGYNKIHFGSFFMKYYNPQ